MENILKHTKVIYQCNNCKKKATKRCIVTVQSISVTNMTKEILGLEYGIKNCFKCKSKDLLISYSFYHEEKIPN
jgi:hypothetical protein